MKESVIPTSSTATKYTLIIKNRVSVPMHENLCTEFDSLKDSEEQKQKIHKWLYISNIEVKEEFNSDHSNNPHHEELLQLFRYFIKKVADAEHPLKIRYYKNLFTEYLNGQEEDIDLIKQFAEIISEYSILHFKVLRLINGILDYCYYLRLPGTNIIPETLAKCFSLTIPELSNEYDLRKQIWDELQKLELRKEADLHMWMTVNKFVWMDLTSDLGKRFLNMAVLKSTLQQKN